MSDYYLDGIYMHGAAAKDDRLILSAIKRSIFKEVK